MLQATLALPPSVTPSPNQQSKQSTRCGSPELSQAASSSLTAKSSSYTYAHPFTDTNAVLAPELWSLATYKFGACGSCSTKRFDGHFYSPPYPLQDEVTRAPRPVITSLSTTTVKIDDSITITIESAASSFALVCMGTATHTVNTDQRRIPLTLTVNGLEYTVWVPRDAGVALPRYWMLFALDADGVPKFGVDGAGYALWMWGLRGLLEGKELVG
jgi:hypothetical protein